MVTIAEALNRYVRGVGGTEEPIDSPVYELVTAALFDLANNPNVSQRGGLRKAREAQKIIMDRTIGRRRPGSLPARRSTTKVGFFDLAGELPQESDDD